MLGHHPEGLPVWSRGKAPSSGWYPPVEAISPGSFKPGYWILVIDLCFPDIFTIEDNQREMLFLYLYSLPTARGTK